MAYADLKYPKTWQVKGCSSQELGLQVDDYLMLEGDGNGGASSTLYKLQGEVRIPWGLGCSYSIGGYEYVAGTHYESGLPFSMRFGVSEFTNIPFHEGYVGIPQPPSTEGEEGSNPGGSWTAEQGG